MKLNPTTLAAIGNALFGPSWQKPLSSALNVDPRTTRRWVAKTYDIPDGIWPELRTICQMRGDILAELAAKLPTAL